MVALGMLLEGASVRSTERITGLHRDHNSETTGSSRSTDDKSLMSLLLVNIPVRDLQCDEIWGYVAKKEATSCPPKRMTIPRAMPIATWRWRGIPSWSSTSLWDAGIRPPRIPLSKACAMRPRQQRFQITTDGFQPYVSAITTTLSDRCDYAMHIKVYGQPEDGERRYSPAEVISSEKVPVMGNPEKKRICTSHIERQNLTIRMQMRRMTRLNNAFSKKWDNLWSAYCLWFAFYNFCRVHSTIRVTPRWKPRYCDSHLESGGSVGMNPDTLLAG